MASEETGEVPGLVERAVGGDAEALRALFAGQRERLKRLVRLRLRRELAGRVDESEVVDGILGEAVARLPSFAEGGRPSLPLSLWVRDLACRRLVELHDRHLGARPSSRPEALTLHAGGLPVADPGRLASGFLGEPVGSRAHDRADRRLYLQEALNDLEAIDREVLALKHFERLDLGEIARVLGLSEAEAGRRYLEAIRRLREVLPWGPGRS